MHIPSRFALIAALIAVSLVGACGQSAPANPPGAAGTGPQIPSGELPEPATPDAASTAIGTRDAARPAPEQVLALWGQAIEARDWSRVRALWGDKGAASGLSEKEFAARWAALRAPRVKVGLGEQEGAAGSIYYAAPVEVTDGTRKFGGTLTIRRVNDVDGASAEQLRWHANGSVRSPWTDRH